LKRCIWKISCAVVWKRGNSGSHGCRVCEKMWKNRWTSKYAARTLTQSTRSSALDCGILGQPVVNQRFLLVALICWTLQFLIWDDCVEPKNPGPHMVRLFSSFTTRLFSCSSVDCFRWSSTHEAHAMSRHSGCLGATESWKKQAGYFLCLPVISTPRHWRHCAVFASISFRQWCIALQYFFFSDLSASVSEHICECKSPNHAIKMTTVVKNGFFSLLLTELCFFSEPGS
jgi:hypothetical protein